MRERVQLDEAAGLLGKVWIAKGRVVDRRDNEKATGLRGRDWQWCVVERELAIEQAQRKQLGSRSSLGTER